MASSAPSPLTARLAADHEAIDGLFREAEAALDHARVAEARTALDRVWMRLAVHIRAEHKAVFPALAAHTPGLLDVLAELRGDHDAFMAALAGAVKALGSPAPQAAVVRAEMALVKRRLAAHNALEEARIYPLADRLPEPGRADLLEAVRRELAFLPGRYGA